ncbi:MULTISPECIES: hypothetical protein [Pseudoalteromonas]|nr:MULTISPECIES: hypothetical protein [Pseudoalteromonas]
MQTPRNVKYFAYGVAVAAGGALLAEVVRSLYRKYTAGGEQ